MNFIVSLITVLVSDLEIIDTVSIKKHGVY